ncbi:MAG TPA: phage holin family protein, partial [Solirubrobacteraceae bacterium]|nr:phage holin family protein [Solirubrobacteraceae bacterium]
RFRPVRLGIAWLVSAAALLIAATFVPGVAVEGFGGALVVAALVGVLNAVLPPLVAALRLPLTLLLGFALVLVLDAAILKLASDTVPEAITVDGFGRALGLALATATVALTLQVVLGTNDDDEYTLHVVRRIARRQGASERTDVPGILFLEVDGLAVPILRQAMRAGSAPEMARWLQDGTHRLAEWETDLSSQTGAAQAGILLGSNEDIPAFRWVEKEAGRLMACSSPGDCAELERRHANGRGLLAGGGTSRGNLLSGEADETILTVSRMGEELRPNPGYRAFLANAHNVRPRPARARGARQPQPRDGRRRGRGPARALPADGRRPPAAQRRVPERAGHPRRQLLRPGARGGLRLRGADLLPRRARRPADPPVPCSTRPPSSHPPSRSPGPSASTRCSSAGSGSPPHAGPPRRRARRAARAPRRPPRRRQRARPRGAACSVRRGAGSPDPLDTVA